MSTLLTFNVGTGIESYVAHVSDDYRFPQTISSSNNGHTWGVTTGSTCWIDTISYTSGYENARASCSNVGNDWDLISDPYVGTSTDRNITVYAEKRATNYACYFYPNGGSPTSTQTAWVSSGGYINLTSYSNNVSRTYYTLTGWLDSDNSTVYTTTAVVGPIYGVKYFYAQWEKTFSTIRLDANGGSFSNGSTVIRIVDTVGDRIYLTSHSQDVSRSGYSLLGWSLSSTATTETWSTTGNIYVTDEDKTYYAVWGRKEIALFYWQSASADATLIAKGKPITNITAARWNKLKAKIRELQLAQGSTWSYSEVTSGAAMTAGEFNVVRSAISGCTGYTTLPAAQSSGNAVKAALFEGDGSLKSALNGAITYYNNS